MEVEKKKFHNPINSFIPYLVKGKLSNHFLANEYIANEYIAEEYIANEIIPDKEPTHQVLKHIHNESNKSIPIESHNHTIPD